MKSKLFAFTLFAATAGVVAFYPTLQNLAIAKPAVNQITYPVTTTAPITTTNPIATINEKRAKIEVVFALDTTSSMSGLIQAAKENIWSIASTMASAQPAPEIKMGLVAFRDRGDSYITRVIDLSPDLDSMYATLMDFQAEGGGDGPESVNQALFDAVHKISWSQDKDSYRVIFLVGDAPPHMDYQNEQQYPQTLKDALTKGIVVNTIQAGDDPFTQTEWRRIAQLNQGSFFQVEQSGQAVAVATPFDEQLASLSREMDKTRMFYGTEEKRKALAAKSAATDKLNAVSSDAALAKRAAFNASAAGEGNFLAESELVDDISSGRVDLDSIAPATLPAPLQALEKDEQAKVIKETAEKRDALRTQIADLSRQRQEFIEQKLKDSGAEEETLDYKIYSTVKAQAAEKGIQYESAPAY
ncbi:vWA domain-containing protein [Hahella sp. NBU794]|uniref:vWA domain-containing protein n=1 Tax=Hahella sp. NBU794 TaxID=3422590 RepID=UPI003D6F4FDA